MLMILWFSISFRFVLFRSISVLSCVKIKTMYYFVKTKSDQTFASYCILHPQKLLLLFITSWE